MNTNKNPTQSNMRKTGNTNYKDETGSGLLSIKDGGMNSANSASLKGKVTSLEDQTNEMQHELQGHFNEIINLTHEKNSLKEMIENKTKDVRNILFQEVDKIDDEITRHITSQKNEHSKLKLQIDTLKHEKQALNRDLAALQNRLKELEMQIGSDDMKEI